MKKRSTALYLCSALAGGLFACPASAVYFNSIIFDMDASKNFISKPIFNDTKRNNLYTLSAYQISRPGAGNEASVTSTSKDLVWSPLKLTVQASGKEYFKLYYHGPKDDVERYYRVVFKETPITLFPWRADQKKMDIIPVVAMSTILIVRPRKAELKYEVDEIKGIIRNTGNTYFRVVLQKGCDGGDESSTQFYMLPGESWQGAEARNGNKKYVVASGRYNRLGSSCFTDSQS